MSSRTLFRGVIWTLVAVVFFGHVVLGWVYSGHIIDEAFVPAPDPIVVPNGEYELAEVTYLSPLGAMDAWYLPAPGTTWVVHIHGLNSTPAQPEVLFGPLQESGYQQLAIAYRNDENQPTDPSGYHQYGMTEWEDVSAAVEYARENGANVVVLAGYGAGAGHALSYVYRHNFDLIGGVITDSANIDVGSTITYRGSQEDLALLPMSVPPSIAWVAQFFTSLRIDVNPRSLNYIDKAQRSLRVPVLAIHGTEDDRVPVELSVALDEVNTDLVRLVQVQGAGHLGAFETDYQGYVTTVLDFLDEVS